MTRAQEKVNYAQKVKVRVIIHFSSFSKEFTIQLDEFTITDVTMTLTSPLCAMVSSVNLCAIRSKCDSLPDSATTAGTNKRGSIMNANVEITQQRQQFIKY